MDELFASDEFQEQQQPTLTFPQQPVEHFDFDQPAEQPACNTQPTQTAHHRSTFSRSITPTSDRAVLRMQSPRKMISMTSRRTRQPSESERRRSASRTVCERRV
jgi:hypothetical protein